jgi:hypothetical protein
MREQSPFPGMDPYLESHWRDLHARLVLYACDQIQAKLPGNYFAGVEERVFLETEDGAGRNLYPDVRVVERTTTPTSGSEAVVVAESASSTRVVFDLEPTSITETYLEIIDSSSGNQVVTVIEFLSSTNKQPGKDQEHYRKKQGEVLQAKVNLVEIDLLRSGRRDQIWRTSAFPKSCQTTYLACVRRGGDPWRHEAYPMPLRQPLPTIDIPLRDGIADVPLDVQALVQQAYRMGRYGMRLDYRKPPLPPLDCPDAEWAQELLKAAT